MNIAICTPVKGRFPLIRVWWMGVERLKQAWAPHRVTAYLAGDELAHRALCEEHGGVWVEHQNEPLSLKWNAVVRRAWLDGADATVILGQDDLIGPNLAAKYGAMFDAGKPDFYAGVAGCTMIEPRTERALTMFGHANPSRIGEVVGAGRVFRRAALDRVGGRPWPNNVRRGLDFRQTMNFIKAGIPGTDVTFQRDDGTLLDIKTNENLWSFGHIAKHRRVTAPCDYHAVVDRFPERDAIRALRDTETEETWGWSPFTPPRTLAAISSIPGRPLEQAVRSLAPQVDQLAVYLAGYRRVPPFLRELKCWIKLDPTDRYGSAAKFLWADRWQGHYLTCDDDILYPDGYVDRMVAEVERWEGRVVVTAWGRSYHGSIASFQRTDGTGQYIDEVREDAWVNHAGTGAMAWDTRVLTVPSHWDARNEEEACFNVWAQTHRVPLRLIARPRDWPQRIPLPPDATTLFKRAKAEGFATREAVMRRHADWAVHEVAV